MITVLRRARRTTALMIPLLLSSSGMNAAQTTQIQSVQSIPDVKGQIPARPDAPNPRPAGLRVPATPLGQGYFEEAEPNGTTGTATPLTGTDLVVRANLFPNGDIDFFSFSGTAGDRIYAATMTSFSAGNSTDSQLTLLDTDGTTVIEFDDDNGSFAGLSSSIAGAILPTTGTYFLKVNDFTAVTASERPYELYLRTQSGAPTPEVESNDTPGTANPLPASGWVSGARNPAVATEQDWYSFNANAGDTVFLSLDLDPEDDLVVWNGRLGIALFGDAGNQVLVVDDPGAAEGCESSAPVRGSVHDDQDRWYLLRLRRFGFGRDRRSDRDLQPLRQHPPRGQRRSQLHHLCLHGRSEVDRPGERPGQLDDHRSRKSSYRRRRCRHRSEPRLDGRHRRPPALAGGQRQRLVHRHRRHGDRRPESDGYRLRRRSRHSAELHRRQGSPAQT